MSILIRTPKIGIPLCEVVKDGEKIVLRVKAKGSRDYEDLPLDQFLEMVCSQLHR